MPPNPTDNAAPIIGIDLGTTNSLVAYADERGPRMLTPAGQSALLPSMVRFNEAGRPQAVGAAAREHAVEHPAATISSCKRLMGRSLADVASDLAYLPYQVVAGAQDSARIKLPGGKLLAPQEVSAWLLRALQQRAEEVLGREVRRAVVTVPAWFDDAQRQATRDAGRLAGLEIVRIINEPTAAALAYGIGLARREAETIAVFDLGGGTFDISILRVTPAAAAASADAAPAADFFEVLATAGDTHLGGDDVDHMIIQLVLEEAAAEFGAELEFPPSQRQALRGLAEAAKIHLSGSQTAHIRIDLSGAGKLYQRTLTRGELEAMMLPWVQRAIDCCRTALRSAKVQPQDVDRIIMVGGATRIPLVRRLTSEFFGKDLYTALDPDHVVALGAAVQASVMAGAASDMLLLDVIPLSLGIETVGGAVAKLITANSSIPARATERFSTSVDGQTSIKLHVLQGEREMVEDCRSLGVFHLQGLPPMPAGIPQVEVEFFVDSGGVLSVAAVERRSGKRARLQVIPNHGLTREEVSRMEQESFAHAREDMARHRVLDLIANAKLDVKWIREGMARVHAALPPDYREQLQAKVNELAAMIAQAEADWTGVDANALHALKEEVDALSVRMHEISIAESLK